tara:strand:+ start:200 stop:592 length:393 start_codon:yes stop_codon:yes gene_type:complete
MENFDLKKYLSEGKLVKGKLIKESAPGYDSRKTGGALPTLESVKAAYEAKEGIEENEEITEADAGRALFDLINDLEDITGKGDDRDVQIDLIKELIPKYKAMNISEYGGEDDKDDDDAMAGIMMDAPDRY